MDNSLKTISIIDPSFQSEIIFNIGKAINIDKLKRIYSNLITYVNVDIPDGIRSAKTKFVELRYKKINKYTKKMSSLLSVISDLVRKINTR